MNKKIIITFLATGLITGLLLTWQLNTEVPIATHFPSDEIEARNELLNSLQNEQSYYQSRIVSLRQQVNESQQDISEFSDEISIELLNALKTDIGLTQVSGMGIEISLDDSAGAIRDGANVTSDQLVKASDIRDIINVLFAANAEAISVNQQRIIANSTVTTVGSSILINNAHVTPPFVIRAVGDRDFILQRMIDSNLMDFFEDRESKGQIRFEVFAKENVSIPIYNGDLQTEYINLVE